MVKHKALVPYTGLPNPYLPIVAPPNSYTMDIMNIESYIVDNEDNPLHAQTNSLNTNKFTGGYKHILVLIETTSRKLYAYPLKTKTADEVLGAFNQFLEDCNERIDHLTMDSGREYNKIKDLLKVRHDDLCVTVHTVVASDGMHTTLSRVDRVIRTLRMMIFNYFSNFERYDWHNVLQLLVSAYNNTQHSSLFVYKGKRTKVYFTPNQVWNSNRLMKLIRAKDASSRNKGIQFKTRTMKLDGKFHFLVNTGEHMKGSKRGMRSNEVVQIKERVGNSYIVSSENKELDGKVIPYRHLIPIRENSKLKESRLLSNLFTQISKSIDFSKIKKEEEKPRIQKPSKKREEAYLSNNILPGRTRSQTKAITKK